MNVVASVKGLTAKYCALWWETPTAFPALAAISADARRKRAHEADGLIRDLRRDLEARARTGDALASRERLRYRLKSSLLAAPGSPGGLFFDEFAAVAEDFLGRARSFDPAISDPDLVQALRNVWIANSLQVYLGLPVRLGAGVFAYSLIYPYSDNLLDDPGISAGEKERFNRALGDRLAGTPAAASSPSAEKVFTLIDLIEEEFPRDRHPGVYDSLLAIHGAQTDALRQQHARLPYEQDILGLSFAKGGTSVMADGFLVKGDLRPEEADFLFGFGCVLQLIDDLQDIRRDGAHNNQTVFSQCAGKWRLDPLVNRVFHFTRAVLARGVFPAERGARLRDLMIASCDYLAMEAAAVHRSLFSRAWLSRLERCAPLSLKAMRGLPRKLERLHHGRPPYPPPAQVPQGLIRFK